MKYFLILLVLVTSFLSINLAYGLWIPQTPQELLEESQIVFVGTITSVNVLEFEESSTSYVEEDGIEKPITENYILSLDEYAINVEEFLKNSQNSTFLTVRQPTTSIPGKIIPFGGFEVGDRVLFYIEEFDGTNTYSKESFRIPEQCDPSLVIHEPRMIGGDFRMMQNGKENQDNFTANSPIQFIAERDMGTLSGASISYDAYISKQVGKIYKERVFNQTIIADSKPCQWNSVATWEFIPDAGNYLLNGRAYEGRSTFGIGNTFFSVWPEPPLKQFNSGIPIDEIQCKDNFVLLQKHNGSPACVKPNSVIELIKRNWMTTEEIEGYAIDFDGDVKHLPFADICTDEMKIILLTHSNIALPDEEFVMEDTVLPFGMNEEDFERCALETSFTKSRWNMITMENSEPFPQKCKSGPAPKGGNWFYDEETCSWIEREWYEGDQFEKIIQYCTDPESNTTGETASINKGGEIKLDSKNCTWMHGGFYNQAWVNQTSDPIPLIQNGNVISPEGDVIRPLR